MVSGFTCPEGHPSVAGDYCDVCGVPIPDAGVPGGASAELSATGVSGAAPAGGPAAGPVADGATAAAERTCPHCGSGDTVLLRSGDYGKLCPAVVVQAGNR